MPAIQLARVWLISASLAGIPGVVAAPAQVSLDTARATDIFGKRAASLPVLVARTDPIVPDSGAFATGASGSVAQETNVPAASTSISGHTQAEMTSAPTSDSAQRTISTSSYTCTDATTTVPTVTTPATSPTQASSLPPSVATCDPPAQMQSNVPAPNLLLTNIDGTLEAIRETHNQTFKLYESFNDEERYPPTSTKIGWTITPEPPQGLANETTDFTQFWYDALTYSAVTCKQTFNNEEYVTGGTVAQTIEAQGKKFSVKFSMFTEY